MFFVDLWFEAWGSSQLPTGTSGNFSCCLRELKLLLSCDGSTGLLEPLQWNQASSRIEGLIPCCFSRCSGKLWFSLEMRWGPQGTSHFASGKSGLLSTCKGYQEIPLESWQGNRVSSRVDVGNSGFLSSCNRDFGVSIDFQQGSQALSRVES